MKIRMYGIFLFLNIVWDIRGIVSCDCLRFSTAVDTFFWSIKIVYSEFTWPLQSGSAFIGHFLLGNLHVGEVGGWALHF